MSDTEKQLYFLQLKIKTDVKQGVDLPKLIGNVSTMLSDNSSVTRCLHKLKVTGESRIVAVMEVTNVIGLERTIAGLVRLGYVEVIYCKPLVPYEEFSKHTLGVDEKLTNPSPDSLTGVKNLTWAEFTIEYPGKSMGDLISSWNKESTFGLGARAAGAVKCALFKVSAERKVHLFTSSSASSFDRSSFKVPMMLENGSNTWVSTQTAQELDYYLAEMSSTKV